jgi:hypothetical protein
MIYTCQRCTQQFERPAKKKGYRYCSQKCANLRQIKLTEKRLRPYAEKGLRATYIATQLKVCNSTLHRAMVDLGLHRLWASRRFKKCASPMAGPSSVSIASATATSPLPESVAQMAAGTNYGN